MYELSSIKDIKHKSKGDENTEKHFTFGPHQCIPSDLNELLKISSFKHQLLHFLYKEYEDPVYCTIMGKKVFYCTTDNECRKFYSKDGVLKFEEIVDLYGYHLKRDTHVIFHMKHADLIDPGIIVVCGGDTDIAIILSSNVEKLENTHLWYNFGVDYNNSHKYIDIAKLAKNMKIIKALPGIYAFTGNDYTPAFSKMEKFDPLN